LGSFYVGGQEKKKKERDRKRGTKDNLGSKKGLRALGTPCQSWGPTNEIQVESKIKKQKKLTTVLNKGDLAPSVPRGGIKAKNRHGRKGEDTYSKPL